MRRRNAYHGSVSNSDVLELVDEDISFSQIIRDYYPDLTAEDIHACIRYAIDLVGTDP